MVLGVGYFTTMQVYVLNLEFVLGVFSLSLLTGQLAFSTFAGAAFFTRKRDLLMVAFAFTLSLAALLMVPIVSCIGTFTREDWYVIYVVSLNFVTVSGFLAVVSLALML